MEADAASILMFASVRSPSRFPATMDGGWISRAEVFETSAPSCGPSLVMSSVKSVASWLARETET